MVKQSVVWMNASLSLSQYLSVSLFSLRWNIWSKLRRQYYYKHSHFKCLFANNFPWCANWIELNWLSHYYNMISLVYLFIRYFHRNSPFPLRTNDECCVCSMQIFLLCIKANTYSDCFGGYCHRTFNFIHVEWSSIWYAYIMGSSTNERERERKKCDRHLENGNWFVWKNIITLFLDELLGASDELTPFPSTSISTLSTHCHQLFPLNLQLSALTQKYIIFYG